MERENMKTVAVLLAPGFEEGEAIVAIDVLRRLKIHVQTIACAQTREVVSYHAIPMMADSTLAESMEQTFDAVVLPGGPEGSVFLAQSEQVIAFVRRHDELGKYLCPICSAAARVLGATVC
jgi:putative intracellular protease/amidase